MGSLPVQDSACNDRMDQMPTRHSSRNGKNGVGQPPTRYAGQLAVFSLKNRQLMVQITWGPFVTAFEKWQIGI
jgi:hypothetical protein